MDNVMRNSLTAGVVAAVLNVIIWIVMGLLGVSHNVMNAPVDNVGFLPIIIASFLGVFLGGIIGSNFGAKGLFWAAAILGLVSLLGPWMSADTYGTFVSLGIMHIVAVACLLYFLVGRVKA